MMTSVLEKQQAVVTSLTIASAAAVLNVEMDIHVLLVTACAAANLVAVPDKSAAMVTV